MDENISVTVHSSIMRMLTSLSVDEILLPKYWNWCTNFRGLPPKVQVALFSFTT